MERKPHICTIDQLAAETAISEYTIRNWIKTGQLKHLKSGRKYFINYDVFMAFLEGQEVVPDETTTTAVGIRPVI